MRRSTDLGFSWGDIFIIAESDSAIANQGASLSYSNNGSVFITSLRKMTASSNYGIVYRKFNGNSLSELEYLLNPITSKPISCQLQDPTLIRDLPAVMYLEESPEVIKFKGTWSTSARSYESTLDSSLALTEVRYF